MQPEAGFIQSYGKPNDTWYLVLSTKYH